MPEGFQLAQLGESGDLRAQQRRRNGIGRRLSSGQKNALRPGEPLSKSSFGSAAGAGCLVADDSDKSIDLLLLVHFGHADEQAIAQLRVPF